MLFSIILPIYNVEKYLQKCVDSILMQTFTDYEIILSDDGSTDSCPAICDRLAEENPQIRVIHKPNGGLSDARNAGTAVAQGDYIIYVDSDDFVLSETFLEKIAQKAENSPDLIFYKYRKYYDSSEKLGECTYSFRSVPNEKDYPSQLKALVQADAFYGMAWVKAVKRSVIADNNISFEVGLLGEDMEWNYHIVCHSTSAEFIDEAFIAYRQREGSIAASQKLKNLTDFIYVLEKWSSRIEKEINDGELKTALYGSLAKYYGNLLIVYSRIKDREKKKYIQRIRNLDRLLKYGMSARPEAIARFYGIFGFRLTTAALGIIDKLK